MKLKTLFRIAVLGMTFLWLSGGGLTGVTVLCFPDGPRPKWILQSCIYDLSYGSASVRPDAAMGYAACENACGKTALSADP